jgi:hypothetical protein
VFEKMNVPNMIMRKKRKISENLFFPKSNFGPFPCGPPDGF